METPKAPRPEGQPAGNQPIEGQPVEQENQSQNPESEKLTPEKAELIEDRLGLKKRGALVLAAMSKEDETNVIREAVELKTNQSKLARIPVISMVIKPMLMAHYFTKSAKAMRDSGRVTDAYTSLGLDSSVSRAFDNESAEYSKDRARHALEELAREDGTPIEKLDASSSQGILTEGESIKKVGDRTSSEVKSALVDYFAELQSAGDNEEAKNKATANFERKVQDLSDAGAFSQEPGKKRNAFLESGVVKYLIGDHSSPNTTNLRDIYKAAVSIQALASEEVSKSDLSQYLDENLSLYNASMKEGVYTKQRVNNVMGAVFKAGVIGGITFSLLGRETRGSINQATSSILSSTLGAAGAGAAAGGILGAIRGIGQARVNMSKAEIKAATSAEKLLTPEEAAEEARKAAEAATANSEATPPSEDGEANPEAAEDAEDNPESATDQSAERKTKTLFGLLERFNQTKRKMTGEEKYAGKVEEALGRKQAKDIYEEINRLMSEIDENSTKLRNKRKDEKRKGLIKERRTELRDLINDYIARNSVSQAEGVDLISFSQGNVSKERLLLATKVTEARKKIEYNFAKNQEKIDSLSKDFGQRVKNANKERRKYMARQALVDGITGALIGGAAGAITSAFNKLNANNTQVEDGALDSPSGESAAPEGDTLTPTGDGELGSYDGEITVGNQDDLELVHNNEGSHSYDLIIDEKEVADIEFNPDGSLTEETISELKEKGYEIESQFIEQPIPNATKEVSISEYFSHENKDENGLFEITGRRWNENNGEARVVVGGLHFEDDGDAVFSAVARPGEDLDLSEMKAIITPNSEIQDLAIVVDIQPDGSVIIPADSPAAEFFDEDFKGGFIEIARQNDDGNIEVFATWKNRGLTTDSITVPNPDATETIFKHTIVVNGESYDLPVPSNVTMATHFENATGFESMKGLDESVGYEAVAGGAITELKTASGEVVEVEEVEHYGNYSESADTYFSEFKKLDGINNSGVSVVREMVGEEGEGLSAREIDQIFLSKIESGEIAEGDVVENYLETMGKSPEAIVTTRAMLGDFQMDLDGDGTLDLIDTQDEINIAADMLSSSDGYSEFVNDTFNLFYEKIDGGTIEFIDYTEEPYQYSTWGIFDEKSHNILQRLGRIRRETDGVGIVFRDSEGNSIYDEATVRRLWQLPENYELDYVADRLNCIQKTSRGIFGKTEPEKTGSEKTEPEKTESEKTEPEKTEPEKTESEKTESEKTEPEKTGSEKTEPEKTGSEKTEPEKTESEKTDSEKTGSEKTDPEITPKGPDANAGDETDLPLTPEQGENFVQPTEGNHVEPNIAPGSQVTTPPTDNSAFNPIDTDTTTGDDTASQYSGDTSGWQGEPEPGPENRPTVANPGSAEPNTPNMSDEELAKLLGL